jgi:hypothetical protein
VNDLKEQVFRVKARLNLLKETVLGGVIGASRCVIRHKNEMGNQFRLSRRSTPWTACRSCPRPTTAAAWPR